MARPKTDYPGDEERAWKSMLDSLQNKEIREAYLSHEVNLDKLNSFEEPIKTEKPNFIEKVLDKAE